MHEASLIHALLDLVRQSAAEHGISKVTKVRLVVGEGYGALPDALEFAFQAMTENTVCMGAMLEIEKKPMVLKCGDCGEEYHPVDLLRRCPFCGAGYAEVVGGRELYVDYYEGD